MLAGGAMRRSKHFQERTFKSEIGWTT